MIDGKGPGADQTPENGLTFGGFAGEQQVAVDNSGTVTDSFSFAVTPQIPTPAHESHRPRGVGA